MGNKYDELDEDEMVEEHGRWGAIKKVLGMAKDDVDDSLGVSDKIEEKKRKMSDDPTHIECRECKSELETAEVTRCPHCGYDPSDYKSKQRKNSIIGGICCATIIGIPIGILFIRRARKQGAKAKKGVVKRDYS